MQIRTKNVGQKCAKIAPPPQEPLGAGVLARKGGCFRDPKKTKSRLIMHRPPSLNAPQGKKLRIGVPENAVFL